MGWGAEARAKARAKCERAFNRDSRFVRRKGEGGGGKGDLGRRTSRWQSSSVNSLSLTSGQNSSNTGLIVSPSPSDLVFSSLVPPVDMVPAPAPAPAAVPIPVPIPEARVPEDAEDAEEMGGIEIEAVEELDSGAEVREALDNGRGKVRPERRIW